MRLDYRRLVHYVHHHHLRIILLALLLSVGAGYLALQLRIETDFANLLPKDYVSVHELNRIKERVGGISPLIIVVTAEDLYAAARFVDVLADSLENNPLITGVVSRRQDRDFFRRNRLLYMERADLDEVHRRLADYIEEEKLRQSPLYVALDDEEPSLDFLDLEAKYHRNGEQNGVERDYLLTVEKNGITLTVYPAEGTTDIKFTRRLMASIDQIIADLQPTSYHPSIRCVYQGTVRNNASNYDAVMQDMKLTSLLSLLGVLGLISLYFRQLWSSIFVAIPLVMSLAWTFGLTYLVIGNLNQITVGLFAILFGLGIDYGIHVFARYREARRRGLEVEAALEETVQHTGTSLTTSAMATAVAFFSMMTADFRGFYEFGFIVGTGILFSLVAMIAVCPAFIVLAERWHLVRLWRQEAPAHLLRRGRYPLPWVTIGIAALATGYALYHLNKVEFEYDFQRLQPTSPKTGFTLPEEVREMRSPAIVLTENAAEAGEVVAVLEKRKAAVGDSSAIGIVRSVYSALPAEQGAKLEILGRIRQLLADEERFFSEEQRAQVDSLKPYLEVRELRLEDLPADRTKIFRGKDGQLLNFVMITSSLALRDGRNAIRFAEEVRDIPTPSGKLFHASSSHIIFAEMLELMVSDGVKAIGLTLLIVFIVLYADLRRLRDTLLALTPLLTGLIWATGIMYLFNIRLNFYNIIAFPTVIGMGIDNSVHIFHRYREEGPGSMRLVLRTTGVALIATSMTNMVGFAGCLSAHHPALTAISTLALIGMSCCFVTSVTLLPALLQWGEGRRAAPPT
ncbi:MAG: MMPL family transporter [Candidatus Handelsmanbacteria bacterium]|nr:MMPL family transporter [Candidatus Handelsmanbacteria bacterium]